MADTNDSNTLTDLAKKLTEQLIDIVKDLTTGDIKESLVVQTKIATLKIAVEACNDCAKVIYSIDNIEINEMMKLMKSLS